MTKKKGTTSDDTARNVMRLYTRGNETPEQTTARELLRPSRQAARTLHNLHPETHEINALAEELANQAEVVTKNGSLERAEGFLVAQAHTLDELFNTLTQRSVMNMRGGYLDAFERYMRLALKAQSQCRTTLETLAEIKNPRPVAFVKQANIAHGPQQVNNGAPAPTHAGESAIQANELKEIAPNEPKAIGVDAGAQSTPVGIDSSMAPVGAINRPEDEGR